MVNAINMMAVRIIFVSKINRSRFLIRYCCLFPFQFRIVAVSRFRVWGLYHPLNFGVYSDIRLFILQLFCQGFVAVH